MIPRWRQCKSRAAWASGERSPNFNSMLSLWRDRDPFSELSTVGLGKSWCAARLRRPYPAATGSRDPRCAGAFRANAYLVARGRDCQAAVRYSTQAQPNRVIARKG